MMIPAAIILGAGKSSRFEGGNKILALLDGKPLLRHVLDTVRQAGVENIVLITGHMAEAVRADAAGAGVRIIHNPDFASGMASSIRVGISALAMHEEAAFLLLADMPLVRASTLECLMEAARENADKQAIIPVQSNRRGNPVLFRAALFPALQGLAGDAGARHLLEKMPDQIHEMPCEDPGIHADFDTREALDRMQ